jgi:hypothetical protein
LERSCGDAAEVYKSALGRGDAVTRGRIAFWGTLSLIVLAGVMIFIGDGPSVRQYGIALLILTGVAILVFRRFGAG